MTGQRRLIIQVLEDSDDHPDVETLFERANKIDSKVSIATVYRTVKTLKNAGILEKLESVSYTHLTLPTICSV